jgi:serine/threonine protein kinase
LCRLCGDGYLKLTDFGLSRYFETRPPAAEVCERLVNLILSTFSNPLSIVTQDIVGDDDVITRSFCGTEQYMSPEMLLQQVM